MPYRGSAPGMIDTIAGRHAFQVDTLGSSKGFLDGGKLRVLAVMADKRLPRCPTCRRSRRAGLQARDQHLVRDPAPGRDAASDRRQAERRLQPGDQPRRRREWQALAIETMQSTPASSKKFYDEQIALWEPIVKASGAKVE